MTDTKETQALEVPNSPIDAMKLGFTQLQHRNRKYYNQGVRQALQSQAEKDRVIDRLLIEVDEINQEHGDDWQSVNHAYYLSRMLELLKPIQEHAKLPPQHKENENE